MLLISECSDADSTIGHLQYCYTFTLECIRVQNLNEKDQMGRSSLHLEHEFRLEALDFIVAI